jgi:hypothetical protein
MTPEEFLALFNEIDGSVASKASLYNQMLDSGMTDAEARALVDQTVEPQEDDAWNWLTSAASVQRLQDGGTVLDKANLYNDLEGLGYSDQDIRNIASGAVGQQEDDAWDWLTAADDVLDLPSNATVLDKVNLYNDLQSRGFSDQNIRNIVQDVLGSQTEEAWDWLTSADRVLDLKSGTSKQKADLYNDFLKSGKTDQQIRSITSDVLGEQSDSDWDALQQLATYQQSPRGQSNSGYQSSLIESLRGSSTAPYSNNPGVNVFANTPPPGVSSWTAPINMGAFNPQVFEGNKASDQQISDWDSYNTYRNNSLNAKSPYLSFSQWLTSDKSDGMPDPDKGLESNPFPDSDDLIRQAG